MTAREIVKFLRADGWFLSRTKGSHAQYSHPDRPALVTVPMHSGDLPVGTLKSIAKQAGLKLPR